jgi:hypothetical protein
MSFIRAALSLYEQSEEVSNSKNRLLTNERVFKQYVSMIYKNKSVVEYKVLFIEEKVSNF